MNRRERRAIERAAKKTHKLEAQLCVVWIADAIGYFETFTPSGFIVVEQAADAALFCEHAASSVALQIRDRFKVRAQVRPYLRAVVGNADLVPAAAA